jgi:AraC-like DNA-binding protein
MDYQSLRLDHFDPDQLLCATIEGAEILQRVLPGGELRVRLEKLRLPGAVLNRGFYSMRLVADGTMPAGVITIGVVTGRPAGTVLHGVESPPSTILLWSEGAELNYHAGPGNSWTGYSVDRERVQQTSYLLCGRPLPIPGQGVVNFLPDETSGRRIVATLDALFALGTYPHPGASIEALARQLEEQLIHELGWALNNRHYRKSPGEARRVAQRRVLMQRAEDYLRANLSEPFSLSDFAEATGANHRTLQRHFRSVYGVTPQTWFRCMKLNALRRELQQTNGTGERISDIAMRWGFLHLGRFSQEYRRLFGECPKDTLRR